MKRAIIMVAAFAGFTCAVCPQGYLNLDNSPSAWGVADLTPGNYYTGPYGMEVWVLNGATSAQLNAINANNAPGGNAYAYEMLWADGFTKELNFLGQSMSVGGTFQLGSVRLPDAVGRTSIGLALVVWNNSSSSFYPWGGIGPFPPPPGPLPHMGVVAFGQYVSNYALSDAPAALTWPGMGIGAQDLVMTQVPEPGTFALAVLGAAALWVLRRLFQDSASS